MLTARVDSSKEWTVEDYLQLEEGLLAQLIDGQLIMSPAPNTEHQRVLRKLYDVLRDHLEGEIFFSHVDLYLNDRNVMQPDLVFVPKERADIVTFRGIEGTPDLIVEIISPSNGFYDRNIKRHKYLQIGVKEYWIIDPAHRTLEIYTPADEDTPRLHVVGEGMVNSLVSDKVNFDLSVLF